MPSSGKSPSLLHTPAIETTGWPPMSINGLCSVNCASVGSTLPPLVAIPLSTDALTVPFGESRVGDRSGVTVVVLNAIGKRAGYIGSGRSASCPMLPADETTRHPRLVSQLSATVSPVTSLLFGGQHEGIEETRLRLTMTL